MTKLPYANTQVSPEHSKADIEHLLKINGIQDIQWTTLNGQTELKFLWKVTVKGVERKIAFGFVPPTIERQKRQSGYGMVRITDERIAFRILFYYLKSKLEAVKFGLETLEQEFMSHIIVSLPDGTRTSVGQQLEEAIEIGHVESTFALPEIKKKVDESRIVDVEP
jgi:hypothetical protein